MLPCEVLGCEQELQKVLVAEKNEVDLPVLFMEFDRHGFPLLPFPGGALISAATNHLASSNSGTI